jgi:pimeloyl-ACP methyl ester carboxylesterase
VTGVDPANVIASWWFSTQSVDDVLAATVAKATPQPTLIVPTGLTTKAANPALPGKADIYVGSTKLPYYLTPPANANDSTSVLTKYWTAAGGANLTMFNPSPLKVADVTVPLLVTMPNATSKCAAKPAGGWPAVVFQHGITNNRTFSLAVADAYADACFIVVSMDLPLHGITDTTSPFYCTPAKPQCLGATERTFNIDIQNNTTGKAGKDGLIDPAGGKDGLTYFNFFNPLVFRDNLRQSEVDLGNLTKSVAGLAFASTTGTTPVGVDPTQIHYLGHSIGAIVGGAHVHFSNDTRTAVLASPGGPISLVAQDSAYYGPVAKALVGASAAPGSYNYNMTFRDIQTVLDAGDSYNHVKSAAAMHPLLMFEVKDDQTIPNSSTNALIAAAGLTKAKAIGPNPVGAGAYTLFTKGDHGTLLNPAASLAATAEMQKQAVLFGATAAQPGGPFVVITDPTVLDLN